MMSWLFSMALPATEFRLTVNIDGEADDDVKETQEEASNKDGGEIRQPCRR